MISNKTAMELMGMAGAGSSLEVDASRFTAMELMGIAGALKPGATLKCFNSDSKTAMECMGIAGAKKGQVIMA